MATRGGKHIDLIWILLDVANPGFAQAIDKARQIHETRGSFKLSVNMKRDGSLALVKIVATETALGAMPGKLRIFTESDHDEAVVMVHAFDWEPLPDDVGDGV